YVRSCFNVINSNALVANAYYTVLNSCSINGYIPFKRMLIRLVCYTPFYTSIADRSSILGNEGIIITIVITQEERQWYVYQYTFRHVIIYIGSNQQTVIK